MTTIPSQGKECSRCYKWKYYDQYRRLTTGRLDSWCKECRSENAKLYYYKNPGKASLQKKKYFSTAHGKKILRNNNLWYYTFNRETKIEKSKKYYYENKEQVLAKQREYRQRKKLEVAS